MMHYLPDSPTAGAVWSIGLGIVKSVDCLPHQGGGVGNLADQLRPGAGRGTGGPVEFANGIAQFHSEMLRGVWGSVQFLTVRWRAAGGPSVCCRLPPVSSP